MSAAQITKRLKTPRRTAVAVLAVAVLAVAREALARAAADRYGFLTLDQAAVLADFDAAQDGDTVKALVLVAQDGPGIFAHAAQRALDTREQEKREKPLGTPPPPSAACTLSAAKGRIRDKINVKIVLVDRAGVSDRLLSRRVTSYQRRNR